MIVNKQFKIIIVKKISANCFNLIVEISKCQLLINEEINKKNKRDNC